MTTRNDTPDLFATPAPATALSLTETLARNRPANKAQQRFQQLVTQIERQRERLQQWQDYVPRYNQRLSGELAPLQEKLRASRKQMALLLDELLSAPAPGRRLARTQREKLTLLLTQLLDNLLQEGDDDELTTLQEKHSDPVDEEEQLLRMEATREILQGMTGVIIDDDHGARTPEELMEYVQRTTQEQNENARQSREPRRKRHRGDHQPESHSKDRTSAAQADVAQAAKEVSQSLRDVFRKLVSALHPDREPDAAERKRKNELMQRVNRAYDASDLLTLLGLQLEIEQIDAAHLSSLTPQRLAQYTQVLREQLANLEAELEHLMQPFVAAMGGRRDTRWNPGDVDRALNIDMAQMRRTLRQLEEDLVAFRDPVQLRRRLAQAEMPAPDPFDDLEGLAEMMSGFQPAPRPRRSRR